MVNEWIRLLNVMINMIENLVRDLTEINLIHKSDVYFDVVEPTATGQEVAIKSKRSMRFGEIYIYLNQIYLNDGTRWYIADIHEIQEIRSISNQKQILIRFINFDLILSCEEYTHLLALRDFLFLAQKNFMVDNLMIREVK